MARAGGCGTVMWVRNGRPVWHSTGRVVIIQSRMCQACVCGLTAFPTPPRVTAERLRFLSHSRKRSLFRCVSLCSLRSLSLYRDSARLRRVPPPGDLLPCVSCAAHATPLAPERTHPHPHRSRTASHPTAPRRGEARRSVTARGVRCRKPAPFLLRRRPIVHSPCERACVASGPSDDPAPGIRPRNRFPLPLASLGLCERASERASVPSGRGVFGGAGVACRCLCVLCRVGDPHTSSLSCPHRSLSLSVSRSAPLARDSHGRHRRTEPAVPTHALHRPHVFLRSSLEPRRRRRRRGRAPAAGP